MHTIYSLSVQNANYRKANYYIEYSEKFVANLESANFNDNFKEYSCESNANLCKAYVFC
jgi:hypothetical protein